jgi:hypothetical protein
VRLERGERGTERGANVGVGHQPVRADVRASERDPRAGGVDHVSADVAQDLGERRVRVGGGGRRRGAGDVEPGHRLAVGAGVADRPLEQVLERAGERAGVLGGGDHERVGGRDRRP